MKKIILNSDKEVYEHVASIMLSELSKKQRKNLALTGGSSPKDVYQILVDKIKKQPDLISDAYFYSFDEIEPGDEQPPITFTTINKYFYQPACIPNKQIRSLTYDNYQDYDKIILEDGGLDFMLLGLGEDGHFCMNMPGSTDFSKGTYMVTIQKEYPWYEEAQALFADSSGENRFVTMGLASILEVAHVVLIVCGAAKAEAVKKMLTLPLDTNFPATGLLLHPNLTIVLDKEAASKCST